MRKNVLAPVLYCMLFSLAAVGQGKAKFDPHPWMFYNRSQLPGLQNRYKTEPALKAVYKNLGKASALRYFIEDDAYAAKEIKRVMFSNLRTARKRLDTDEMDPLQWGRRLQEWIVQLEPVVDDDRYFSAQERIDLAKSCDSIAQRCEASGFIETKTSNRALDELMGLAYVGVFLFPDNPNVSRRYDRIVRRIDTMLMFTEKFDTTWPESPRYVNVALRCLSMFAMAQVNYETKRKKADPNFKGTALLINDKRYLTLYRNYALLASAPDALANNYIESPGIGDAAWTRNDLNVLCMGAVQTQASDPALSKFLYITWEKTNRASFWPDISSPYIDYSSHADPSFVVPSLVQRAAGFFVSRNHYNSPLESYFIIRASRANYSHVHADAGAFSLFSRRVPLMVHPGTSAYGTPEQKWFRSTEAQNVVVFRDDHGNAVNGMENGVNIFKEHRLSPQMDFVKLNITPVDNKLADKYFRTVAALKDPQEIYVIFDYIESTHASTNNLHYLTKAPVLSNSNGIQRAICEGNKEVSVQTDFLLPETNVSIDATKTGDISRVPGSWGLSQRWIQVNAEKGESYLTVIAPRGNAEANVLTEKWPIQNPLCKAFAITTVNGTKYLVIANLSDQNQSVDIRTDMQLRNLYDNTLYPPPVPGKSVAVAIRPSTIAVFKMQSINATLPVQFISFEAKAVNDHADLTWSVIPEPNNDRFTVQRSATGSDQWESVAIIAPQALQGSTETYSYTDKQPLPGKSYYRIMQTDVDGKSVLSVIRIISFSAKTSSVVILGNPVHGLLRLRLPTDNRPYTIQVLNAGGQVIRQQQFAANAGIVEMEMRSVTNGAYFVSAVSGPTRQVQRIILINK